MSVGRDVHGYTGIDNRMTWSITGKDGELAGKNEKLSWWVRQREEVGIPGVVGIQAMHVTLHKRVL
jgi:hypothetical protein